MTVGPVHWGSYGGDALEHAMSVLLLQTRSLGWHRATSQGDGGIDVVNPLAAGYEVFQIKGFTTRDELRAGQRRQIKDSFNTVKTDPRLDRPVTRSSLVVPVDPNNNDERRKSLGALRWYPAGSAGRCLANGHPGFRSYYVTRLPCR